MEIGVLAVVLLGLFFGFLVLQGTFAARAWRERIAAGDLDVLREALDEAFAMWREMRPPKGMPPSDWAALASPELVAADRDRARVSLVADADIRVVAGERREVAGPLLVGRRVALRMAERLFYEIPHVYFAEVQIDVWERYRDAEGVTIDRALLTTRATREQAAAVDWAVRWEFDVSSALDKSSIDVATATSVSRTGDLDPSVVLGCWRTREATSSYELDPDSGYLIRADEGIRLGLIEGEAGSCAEMSNHRSGISTSMNGSALQ